MLELVPDSIPDETQKRRMRIRKPGEDIQCQCGCREVMQVTACAQMVDGIVSGGTKQWLCVDCFMRGDRKVLA